MPKISELTSAVSVNTTDILPIVQSGTTYKTTFSLLPISTAVQTALDLKANSADLGTMSTQNANNVAITGGSVTGITDVAVADGGTGASTAAGARTNLGAAASGANSDITSLNSLVSVHGSSISGFRNRIINGNFKINQRSAASGSTAYGSGVYVMDRWKAGSGGCTLSWATSGSDVIVTITAGSLIQVIEDVNVEGGVYTLSNAGTAQARVGINNTSPAGSYAACPLQSASATGGQAITVEFTTGTLDRVQLELGTVATTFERRAYGTELALCQRYYEADQVSVAGYILNSGSNLSVPVPFKVTKRIAPTMTTSSVVSSSIVTVGAPDLITTGKFQAVGITNGTGSGDGNFTYNWTASAEL